MTMSSPPPVVIQQKKGMGCFGIGCIVVVIVLLLIGGLIAGIGYLAYSKAGALTTTTPETTRSFDGGDDLYNGAQQKLAAFGQALQQNKPATLELSADEINTLITRDANVKANQIHAFVTLTGDRADLQTSFPTSMLPFGVFPGRFINGEANFTPSFDPATKNIIFSLHTLKMGSQTFPDQQLPALQAQFQPFINTQLQRSQATRNFLDHAQSVEIRDGKLVIQTQ